MDMNDQDESRNVEDVRGSSGGGFRPVHGVGLGTVVVALIAGWAFGINPLQILGCPERRRGAAIAERARRRSPRRSTTTTRR